MQTAFVTGLPVCAEKGSVSLSPNPENVSSRRPQSAKWTMAKKAKFGPFTPAVLVSRVVLGDKKLNTLRGKGIALHSKAITAFCGFTGAGPKTRQALMRQAKNNGNTLGFLS